MSYLPETHTRSKNKIKIELDCLIMQQYKT